MDGELETPSLGRQRPAQLWQPLLVNLQCQSSPFPTECLAEHMATQNKDYISHFLAFLTVDMAT